MKPRLIGAIADLSLSVARTTKAHDRGEHPDRTGGQREHESEGRVQPDRLEGRDAEDDRGQEGDLVAPNRSAAMPAQSPTLSPTLSAIVAGLRGSSSGMPASTLPTRSAPTSAALVKMPPPTRRKSASSEPPNPNPMRIADAVF